jgi:hypothetical protein
MRKFILIPACLAAALGLLGCQKPNTPYTVYYAPPSGAVNFASPYDSPAMSPAINNN